MATIFKWFNCLVTILLLLINFKGLIYQTLYNETDCVTTIIDVNKMVYFNKYFSLLAACIFPPVQTKPYKIIQRFITFGTDKLLDGFVIE